MRIKTVPIVFVLAILATALTVYAGTAGNLEPPNPPASTSSYTLEDVYSRLDTGAAGTQSTFTEPGSGPGTGTMHTLNDTMGVAPTVDDTNGATAADVVSGKTFWGLTPGSWGLQTGTLTSGSAAPVPKTGQTIPHTTGDDGDLQMGVAWPVPRFITGATGVVTDTLTGLIWLENAHCAQTTEDWNDALLGYITELNAFGTMNGKDCGDTSNEGSHQTDWRLPNLRELQSLVHYGFYGTGPNLALPDTIGTGQWSDGDPFIGVQPWHYWTSTSRASLTTQAWSVDVRSGEVGFYPKATSLYGVWPVRGGQ
jgi:hypothetical protein